ncbi:MAG: hypothetical protein JXN59_11510 [Anaerolineae bacterium]|nr:hypothetical protein [Anaerolineae bacterium]
MPVIEELPAFKAEPDSGNLAFLAAQAVLLRVGVQWGIAQLAGASGDAFKFVYDNAPVKEPLRDLRGWDSLARAFTACGLRAEWVPDATLDHVRGQVEAHAAVQQPILTSGLRGVGDNDFALLVGYDEDTDTLTYLRGTSNPSAAAGRTETLILSDGLRWSGPITGVPHRVDFPLLVIRGALYNPPDEQTQRRAALQTALDVLYGDPIAYPAHPDAQQYADVPLQNRRVRQGLAGLALLAEDLEEADLSAPATLWRLDALLRQLAWDRELAVIYLESWGGSALAALIGRYRTIAHTARTLLTRNWERRSAALYSLDDLRGLVSSTSAYLYALPDDAKIRTDAVESGLGTLVSVAHGTALLVETPERRTSAARLARRLQELEQSCEPLLKQALSAV